MKLSINLLDSPYKVGLAYENLTLAVLKKYAFHLKRTGATGDRGRDFTGFWNLQKRNIPVIGQCKCYKKPIGPKEVREFEGVLYRMFVQLDRPLGTLANDRPISKLHVRGRTPGSRASANYVGVLVSKNWFSASALRLFHSSQMAMILMQIVQVGSNSALEQTTGNGSDSDSTHPNDMEMESITDSGPDSHSSYPNDTRLKPNSLHENYHYTSGQTERGSEEAMTESQAQIPSELTTDPDSHSIVSLSNMDSIETSEEVQVGYVNDIALNTKARKAVGDVQVTWKWSTGKSYSQRQLFLVM